MLKNIVGREITVKVVEIFAAVTNSELNEGRGHDVDHSYHTTQLGALAAAEGIGVMGNDGEVETRLVLTYIDPSGTHHHFLFNDTPVKVEELDTKKIAALKSRAVEQLSPAQRAALGLTLAQ